MRILFWSELFWPYLGGVEILAASLVSELRSRGCEMLVLTSHAHLELPDEDEYAGIAIRRVRCRAVLTREGLAELARSRRRVIDVKRSFAPDVIHLFALGPSALLHFQTNDAGTRTPMLMTLHGEILRPASGGPQTLLEKSLLTADWITAVSRAVADAAARLSPVVAGRISVIHTGLPTPDLIPADPPVPPRLVCLGRLVRDKGFDVALRAFQDLTRDFPDVRLTIAGDGPESGELQRLTGELGLREVVNFTGWVAPDQVPHLLNQATAVMMPSRREGMPLVAIQAAQMGRPVVAARTGGLPEVVIDGGTGLLVDPDDPAALREATASLLSTPELVKSLGAAAFARARELFTRERSASLYHAVYQRLAATPQASAT